MAYLGPWMWMRLPGASLLQSASSMFQFVSGGAHGIFLPRCVRVREAFARRGPPTGYGSSWWISASLCMLAKFMLVLYVGHLHSRQHETDGRLCLESVDESLCQPRLVVDLVALGLAVPLHHSCLLSAITEPSWDAGIVSWFLRGCECENLVCLISYRAASPSHARIRSLVRACVVSGPSRLAAQQSGPLLAPFQVHLHLFRAL